MKKIYLCITVLLFSSTCLFAQMKVDKSIELTGSGSDAKITGIKSVTSLEDAVSVQALREGTLNYAVSTGTGAAYSVNLAPAITGYSNGMVVHFKAHTANTGASTLSVNGQSAVVIKKNGNTDLANDDIAAGQIVTVIYDGSVFQMSNWGGASSIGGAGTTNYVTKFTGSGLSIGNSAIYDNGISVGIGTSSPGVSLDVRTTDAVKLPAGNTSERPASPLAGSTRFNTQISALEYYDGTQRVQVNAPQMPPCTIMPYAGSSVPSGWLLCDGSAVNRTTYASLYAAIGNGWGSGDNVSTFNLPDFRGRFLRGVDGSAGRDPDAATRVAANAGGNTGNAVGSVQSDAVVTHTHAVTGASAAAGAGTTSASGATTTSTAGATTTSAAGATTTSSAGATTTSAAGAHAHSYGGHWSTDNAASVAAPNYGDGAQNTWSDGINGIYSWNNYTATTTGGNHSHNLWAPVHDVNNSSSQGYPYNHIHNTVRSTDRGRSNTVGALDAAGSHAHSVYLPNHRHWIQPRNTGTQADHSHTIGNHTHTIGDHTHTIAAHAHTIGDHTHTVSDHTHSINLTSGNPSAANTGETRPENANVIYIIKY